jgi:hypothetical protein
MLTARLLTLGYLHACIQMYRVMLGWILDQLQRDSNIDIEPCRNEIRKSLQEEDTEEQHFQGLETESLTAITCRVVIRHIARIQDTEDNK